jgi:GNAT superfamily N-acetyltransferase
MRGLAAGVRHQANRFGAAPAAHYFAWRLADRLVGYMPYRGLVLPGPHPQGFDAPTTTELLCREVALDELMVYASDLSYDLSERFLSEASAAGSRCFGAFARGKLVSYAFHASTPTNVDRDFCFHFPRGWVYHFKAFTLPEWRGRKLHASLVRAAIASVGTSPGFRGLATLVVATNYPSLASFARMGFKPAFRFVIVGKGDDRRVLALRDETGERFSVERVAPGR